jgi:hypothetical protein
MLPTFDNWLGSWECIPLIHHLILSRSFMPPVVNHAFLRYLPIKAIARQAIRICAASRETFSRVPAAPNGGYLHAAF